jgi:acyl-CoA thioester hydrolase
MIKSNVAQKHYFFDYRVYTEDTDALGVVYHANYLCFFERARTEMLRDIGFSLSDMAVYKTYFVINELQISYKSPARLDDVLTIQTSFELKKRCGLLFKQVMRNQLQQILSEAMVQAICVDSHLKPKRLPEPLVQAV